MAGKAEIGTLHSRVVYRNRWMRVREDAIRRQDGTPGLYGVVEKPDFVVVVPREADGSIHLVQQFRYPVGARYWEFPQGAWEGQDHPDPLALARGELREETGLSADQMLHAGRLFQGYGYSTQACDIFLATGLRQGPAQPEAEEQGLIARAFPAAQVERMLGDGTIVDAISVAAFGLLRLQGRI